jgi:hypothetical protein
MYKIELNIEKEYLITFLSYLETIQAIQIKKITQQPAANTPLSKRDQLLQSLPATDPLRQGLRPIRKGVSLKQILKEQNYQGTDWAKVDAIAIAMNIQEPLEDLLNQLKS